MWASVAFTRPALLTFSLSCWSEIFKINPSRNRLHVHKSTCVYMKKCVLFHMLALECKETQQTTNTVRPKSLHTGRPTTAAAALRLSSTISCSWPQQPTAAFSHLTGKGAELPTFLLKWHQLCPFSTGSTHIPQLRSIAARSVTSNPVLAESPPSF